MAKFKAAIRRNEINSDGKTNIKIRVFHNAKTRYIGTDYYMEPKYFNTTTGRVKPSHPYSKTINAELKSKELEYEKLVLGIENVDRVNIATLIDMLKRPKVLRSDFFVKLDDVIRSFKKKKSNTWVVYQTTRNTLQKFTGQTELDFSSVDYKFLQKFESWLLEEGKGVNYISIHMRNIRSVFNKAIDEGLIGLELYPFRRFKIQQRPTRKRDITIGEIHRIITLEQKKGEDTVVLTEKEEQARDIFLLSFFLIGINMRDLYFLKPDNVKNERLEYVRGKTHKPYSIKIEPEALYIINRYKDPTGEMLLNFHNQYSNHQSFDKYTNKFLKRVSCKLELDESITTYYARHSWASIAANNGISKDIIARGLGHGTSTVTDIYIDFDMQLVDEANRKIIDLVSSNNDDAFYLTAQV